MATHTLVLKPGDTLSATVENVITPPVNIPPIVSAGANQTIKLPLNKVTLAGAVSDPDGIASGLVVVWAKVSGLAATIGTANAISTEVSNLVEGIYTFRLTATDPKGGVTSSVVTVTVLKADPAPPTPGKPDYMNLPVSLPLDLSGKSNIVVENKRFVNAPSISIKMYAGANNITIRNCFFDGAAQELVELENANNITIENCLFAKGYSGVYSVDSRNIKIINCQFINMRIKYVNGGFAGKGQFVQMNSCADIEISGCKGENFPEADPEDMISFYRSSNGVVKNNIFRGNPVSGWSTSGGGIICGDNGGNNVVIENNSVINPGQYGLAVSGGTNMSILNNKIYSDRNPVSNNPLYAWNQSGAPMVNVTVKGNRVNWTDKNGGKNNGWNAGNGTNIVFETPTTITLAEMNIPAHLIDMVTPAELLKIRGK